MAEFEGNVLRPPGVGSIRSVLPPEELIASYNPPPLKKGGTVKAGVGVLRVGEAMARDSDGTYKKAGANFSGVVALNETAVDCTTEAHLVNLIFGGVVTADVAAITAANGAALATALGGTYIDGFHYIKF